VFTIAGFYETSGSTTLDYVAAMADPSLSVLLDDVVVPRGLPNLGGVWVRSNSITDGRVDSPSLRKIANLKIFPMRQQWQVDFEEDAHWMDMMQMPIALEPTERINLLCAENGVGDDIWGFVLFMDQIDPVPTGPWRTIRLTGTTTLTVNTWTNVPLTLDEDLPAGRYAIIGAGSQSSGLRMWRLVNPPSPWRPGGVGIGEPVYPCLRSLRFGAKGSWGEFEHDMVPSVDCCSASADTAERVWMDVVQVRSGPG